MSRALLAVLVLVSVAAPHAQPDSTASRPALFEAVQWLQAQKISVRQAFDGSSGENKPATLILVNDQESNDDYFLVDLAVKVGERDLLRGTPQLLVYPVVEWHRADREENPIGIVSGSLKAEFRPVGLRTTPPGGGASSPGWPVAPLILGSVGYANDYEGDEAKTTASAHLSLASRLAGLPGSDLRYPDNSFLGRYYPYVGYERYGVTGDSETDVGVVVGRLYAEVWPLSFRVDDDFYEYVQLVADVSYRRVVSGEFGDSDAFSYVSLSANIYPDGQGAVGVGISYQRGEDPSKLLQRVDITSVGLKIKL